MIEELIARIFATRNAAHLEHWRTSSFSQHDALGDFYEGLPGAIDKIVEAHMGAFDVIGEVDLKPAKSKGIVEVLEADMVWISEHRAKVTGKLPALDNMLQELEGLYLSTLFKLKRLK